MQPMLGYIKTTSLIKLAHLIKRMAVIMDLNVPRPSSAEIVPQERDAGPNKEPKFIVSKSMAKSVVKKTS